MMNSEKLKNEISCLISLKQEGEYWDFKKRWHSKKADLLHDIICMANNLADHDAYIIIGVEDNTYEICDISSDANRKNTQQITDFLKDKKFAGGIRPRVVVQTILLDCSEVDILIVENSRNTPFFLTEDYKVEGFIKANHIYTRIIDTNTPKDKSADINNIEYLWKKRFGIDKTSLERFKVLLDDVEKWNIDWDNRGYGFHEVFPEYRMQIEGEYSEGWIPQSAFYTSSEFHAAKLNILYHNTIIYETEIWTVDEYRKHLPQARTDHIKSEDSFYYSYYVLSDIEGKMLTIFTDGSNDLSSREPFRNQFLIFANEEEHQLYREYATNHMMDFEEMEVVKQYHIEIEAEKNRGSMTQFSALHVGKAAIIYEAWKTEGATL